MNTALRDRDVVESRRPELLRLPLPSIRRRRVGDWIDALESGSPRLLVAPVGFGKTTILLQIAYERGERALYVACGSGVSLHESIGTALGEGLDESTVLRRLEAFETVLIDDLERLDRESERFFDRIVQNARIRNLVCASTRQNVVKSERIASGLVSICTTRLLAFSAVEIAQLAADLDVRMSELEMLDLRERCEGWPIAVTGALRAAHAFATAPAIALGQWKSDQRTVIFDLIDAALAPDVRRSLTALLDGEHADDRTLRQLGASGAPVVVREDGCASILRIVRELHGGPAAIHETLPPLTARLFGTFECSFDEKPVVWLRRMDRRLFRYLLLTKDGSEDRQSIIERFWPSLDATSALQSLRTTCSNIKKALAGHVGADRVSDYFTSGERIAVNLENVNVDVRRFLSHVRIANERMAADVREDALYHYGQADRIYTAHLGWGDEADPALLSLAEECHALRLTGMRNAIAILKYFGRTLEANALEMLLVERTKRHHAR